MKHRKKTNRSAACPRLEWTVIHTTLYQLVEAVGEILPIGDDAVVAMTVDDILNRSEVGNV